MILKAVLGSVLLAVAEVKLSASEYGGLLPQSAPLSVPPLFGLVVLVNVVAASYVVTGLGSAVGKARERCALICTFLSRSALTLHTLAQAWCAVPGHVRGRQERQGVGVQLHPAGVRAREFDRCPFA
jgi:hypothetical protein